jgi:hypothetical protein
MQKELTISPREGTPFAISEYLGKVVVIAFISKAACLTGPSLELVDQLLLEIGPTQFMSVACIVDLERDEAVREYSPFLIPIGATPRRQVAEFLNVSMSGFPLPQFLLMDRTGKHRYLLCVPQGNDFWEMVDGVKKMVDMLLAEKAPAPLVAEEQVA